MSGVPLGPIGKAFHNWSGLPLQVHWIILVPLLILPPATPMHFCDFQFCQTRQLYAAGTTVGRRAVVLETPPTGPAAAAATNRSAKTPGSRNDHRARSMRQPIGAH